MICGTTSLVIPFILQLAWADLFLLCSESSYTVFTHVFTGWNFHGLWILQFSHFWITFDPTSYCISLFGINFVFVDIRTYVSHYRIGQRCYSGLQYPLVFWQPFFIRSLKFRTWLPIHENHTTFIPQNLSVDGNPSPLCSSILSLLSDLALRVANMIDFAGSHSIIQLRTSVIWHRVCFQLLYVLKCSWHETFAVFTDWKSCVKIGVKLLCNDRGRWEALQHLCIFL